MSEPNWPQYITKINWFLCKFTPIYVNLPTKLTKNANTKHIYPNTAQMYTNTAWDARDIFNVWVIAWLTD